MPRTLANLKSKLLIAIGFCGVVGLVVITNPRPAQASVAANDLRSAAFVGWTNCQLCDWCTGVYAHVAVLDAQGLRGGSAHSCQDNMSFNCDNSHPIQTGNCSDPVEPEGLTDLALAAAWTAAVSADTDELPNVLARSNTNWQYNRERHAIQWPGCNGTIIASLPLTGDRDRAVAATVNFSNN